MERVSAGVIRLAIDSPDGVDLGLCERVTKHLRRPARGRRARGLLARPRASPHQAGPLQPLHRPPCPHPDARRTSEVGASSFTGELVGADGEPSRWLPTTGSSRSRTRTSSEATSWRTENVERDRRGRSGSRAREGNLRRPADGRSGGRIPLRLQEDARRGQVRAGRHGPRHRRLQGLRADAAGRAGGAAPGRGRGRGGLRGGSRDGRATRAARAGDRPRGSCRVRRSDRRARRDAGQLRPHRGPDGQAGDPPADPRGRARHDVRRVPGPRRRAGHRDHPADGLPLHPRAAARACRGPASQVRAGRQRALRPRRPRQGHHHRRQLPVEGPEHHRLAPLARADQGRCSSSRSPRSPTAWSRSRTWPASPATARRSP